MLKNNRKGKSVGKKFKKKDQQNQASLTENGEAGGPAEVSWADENLKPLLRASSVQSKAFKTVAVFCIIAGPVALGIGIAKNFFIPPQQVVQKIEDTTINDALVKGVALRGVKTWFEATTASVPPGLPALARTPNEGAMLNDLSVVDFTNHGQGHYSVTVQGYSPIEVPDPLNPDMQIWEPKLLTFAVPITVDESGGHVAGVPALLPTTITPPAQSDFKSQIDPANGVYETMQNFLNALILGQGEINRYVSAGSDAAKEFSSPLPAGVFTKVEVSTINAPVPLPGNVPEGYETLLEITAVITRGDGGQMTSAYRVNAVWVSSRWEITKISDFQEANTNKEK